MSPDLEEFFYSQNVAIRGRREWGNLENYEEESVTFKWESSINHLEKIRQILLPELDAVTSLI
jgi:hypothetical protein